jgi:hypothetical protein
MNTEYVSVRIDDYQLFVSLEGSVQHLDRRGVRHALTPNRSQCGYWQVKVQRRSRKRRWFFVHRLLAMAYLPNPDQLPQVRHLDGNRENNNLSNLAWGTHTDNMRDRNRHGTQNWGERCGAHKLTDASVRAVIYLGGTKMFSQQKIAEMFGVRQGSISDILLHKTWRHLWPTPSV